VDDFRSKIGKIVEGYKAEDIFNADETGLFFKALPDKTLRGHQCFFFLLQNTGRLSMFMFLKHLGCLAFPITKGFSFSPVLLLASITVIRSFASFPPLHASPLGASVLSGGPDFQ
jgi:hypothetical protein